MKVLTSPLLTSNAATWRMQASKKALAAQGPLPAKEELLSYNKAALQWNAIVSVQVCDTVKE